MKKLKRRQIRELVRFGEYMASGNAQFWSGYLAFALFDAGFGMAFWPAKSLSYFIGVSVNFLLERFWVFKQKKITKRQVQTTASRFYLLMFVNFLLDLAIVGGLRELGLTPYLGQFVSAGFFTVWNYLLFKLWVFARKRHSKGPAINKRQAQRKVSRARV
jgi:putative flippase GtrA